MDSLNPEDIIPLYQQLKMILKDKITNGEYKPNQKIPSETQLSQIFNVSRITVRNAISELVEEDLLVKKQGKGTFVSTRKIEDNILEDISFSLTCEINQVRPGSKIINNIIIRASERDIKELGLTENDKVVYIKRIRYANDEPIVIEHNYFPEKFSFLIDEDLENQSLYELLKKKCNVTRKASKKTIEISIASEDEASLLHISKGEPLLLHREIVFDENNEPIHRTKQLILGEKFKFVVQ
ncbi:MAG: GntR family transcriptional regulator [Tissierellaceae bacterium]|nr:GntR family transcriptional regulator [Tissierellaceae bacterium]